MTAEGRGRHPTPTPDGDRFVSGLTLLAATIMLAGGGWALLGPGSFAEFVRFPEHTHFVHDLGAFQIGTGLTRGRSDAWLLGVLSVLTAVALALRTDPAGDVVPDRPAELLIGDSRVMVSQRVADTTSSGSASEHRSTHVTIRRTGNGCEAGLDSVGFATLWVDPADSNGNSTGGTIYYSDPPYGPCCNRDIGYRIRKFQTVPLWANSDRVDFSIWFRAWPW